MSESDEQARANYIALADALLWARDMSPAIVPPTREVEAAVELITTLRAKVGELERAAYKAAQAGELEPETPTLRDYFAAKALPAYIAAIAANPEAFEDEAEDMEAYLAECAYTTADAMIAARGGR